MTRPLRVAHVATIDLTHRYLLLGQLRALRDAGYEVTAISGPGPNAKELEAEGIRHVAWPHASRAWDPVADARAFWELVAILRAGRFDVVHTHNPKPGILGRIAARLAGVPIVVNTVHGFYATPEDGPAKRGLVLGLERLAASFSDLELFQSEEDLEWARRARVVDEVRGVHLGNGTDLSTFDPSAVESSRVEALRRELGIGPNELVVGTVGRLVAEKGYRELFAAARRIRRDLPNVRFLAVGPMEPDKADAIDRDEIDAASGDVVFTGFRTDTRDLLALMDVFVLASWREGMPRSAIEAAVMGRPLVLTDIRGCREVARGGRAGVLVPPRDAVRLAEAIERLLRDADLRAGLGKAAAAGARERFDERRVAGTVLARYRGLLRGKGLANASGRLLDAEGLRSVRIRPARVGDVGAIARLHAEVLPTAFLPMLGEPFLRELFRALVRDPRSIAVVADRDGEVVGYAGGMLSVRGFRRRLVRRHWPRLLAAAAPRLVRPSVLRRLLQTAGYPKIAEGLPDSETAFLGVRRATAPGLGGELTREVLDGLAELGAEEVKGFVARDNRAMNHMMRRLGFEQRAEIAIHDDRPSNVYVIDARAANGARSGARL
jgi:glycosyltransferase involved in cell wall biosynthesis/ribosomal protein S18 acetylase RimI-like enzyme